MIHNLGLILLQYKCLGLCCSSFAVALLTTGLQSLLQPSVIEAVLWLLSLMVCLLLQDHIHPVNEEQKIYTKLTVSMHNSQLSMCAPL